VRQIWVAASLNSGCRPRLPVSGACNGISRSNSSDSEQRCFSAVLCEGRVPDLVRCGGPPAWGYRLPHWM
jgi:hypothetical protein